MPARLAALGVRDPESYEVYNSFRSPLVPAMVDRLYQRLQRLGYLRRDCERLVNRDRNIFGALLLKMGEPDAMFTGVTRTYAQTLRELRRVLDPQAGQVPFGVHVLVGRTHTIFLADTSVNERPTPAMLADIAEGTARLARRMGQEPRVAFLSYSNFGNPAGTWLESVREAVRLLEDREPDFEFEGEMAPGVALNPTIAASYSFSRLTGAANVLVMAGIQSASISAKLMRELSSDAVIGPVLLNVEKPLQIASMGTSASELVTLAVLAAGGMVR